jgi:hypothetical protein
MSDFLSVNETLSRRDSTVTIIKRALPTHHPTEKNPKECFCTTKDYVPRKKKGMYGQRYATAKKSVNGSQYDETLPQIKTQPRLKQRRDPPSPNQSCLNAPNGNPTTAAFSAASRSARPM